MIILKNVTKTYQPGEVVVKALDGITLTVEQGEFAAIIGPSGSGKSTLMNIIGCLDTMTEGEFIFNQTSVSDYTDRKLANVRNRQIGFVFQQFNLLPNLTALENVEVPLIYAGLSRAQRRKQAESLLQRVGLHDRLTHKPTELSGGQQQRVSIARALSNNPSLLLADEPTGALDTKTGHEVLALLQELNASGKTVLVITHDPNIANHARRIITLRDGKIESDRKKGDATDVL